MAISAVAVGGDDVLIWVTTMSTGASVQGASVRIFEQLIK